MPFLASVMTTVVLAIGSVAPSSNLPQVLGVRTAQDTTINTQTTDIVRDSLSDTREERDAIREEFRARRAEAEENLVARRAEFQERLQEIRNERKQQILERLAANQERINSRWVEHLNNTLARLSELLAKVDSRAQAAEANGADVSDVVAAIEEAEGAIVAAQAAVDEQAGKVYVPEFDSETTLGADVRAGLASMREDLRATMDEVKAARAEVVDAISLLRGVSGEHRNLEPGNNETE